MQDKVTVYIQTADRTRKAMITLPRSMRVSDVIKISSKKWLMSIRVNYQIANTTSGRFLHANDTLTNDKVHNGDVLMLQPFPTHGSATR